MVALGPAVQCVPANQSRSGVMPCPLWEANQFFHVCLFLESGFLDELD